MIDWKKHMTSCDEYSDFDDKKMVENLVKAIQCKTVSYFDISKMDGDEFLKLHKHFETAYPLVHKNMTKEIINNWSLLYHWKGTEQKELPVLFMGHLDVVPVSSGTENDWDHPCFGAEIADGYIWGRGAIDCKSLVVGLLEATEYLMKQGYQPKRDVYFAFGHDEESLGGLGTEQIMNTLKARGVTLDFVVDEGGSFADGADYGAPNTILATVGTGEKGYADVIVTTKSKGGHSSQPDPTTALGDLARAIVAIEDNKCEAGLCASIKEFYASIAPFVVEEPMKTYLSDIEKYTNELLTELEKNKKGNSFIRTTTAATQCFGSPAPNVLPQKAEAIFNFRLSPLDTLDKLMTHLKSVVAQGVEVELLKGQEPSKTSPTNTFGYNMLKELTGKYYKDTIMVPMLVLGGTDCRFFEDICDNCYRYRPFIGEIELGHLCHGTNERVSIESQIHGTKFLIDAIKIASNR